MCHFSKKLNFSFIKYALLCLLSFAISNAEAQNSDTIVAENDSLERENKAIMETALCYIVDAEDKEATTKHNQYKTAIIIILAIALLLSIYFLWRTQKNRHVLKQKELVLNEKETINKAFTRVILENKFNDLLILARSNSPGFLILFNELYPEFIVAMKTLDTKIRNSELAFCAMAFLNFSTKNIAEYTFVTARAVQIRRNRLRKKFDIPSEVDFNVWMRERVKISSRTDEI